MLEVMIRTAMNKKEAIVSNIVAMDKKVDGKLNAFQPNMDAN